MLNEHEAVWKHWSGRREEEQFPASSLALMRGLARLHRNGSPGPRVSAPPLPGMTQLLLDGPKLHFAAANWLLLFSLLLARGC